METNLIKIDNFVKENENENYDFRSFQFSDKNQHSRFFRSLLTPVDDNQK
jgi:hypothetical protein